MPELLLELLSEEIPARMQSAAAVQLERLMQEALKEAGLAVKAAKAFATPRRLALVIDDLPPATEHVREERKGPRIGAPEAALAGFLRSTGLAKSDLKTKSDGKGEFYIAVIEKPGRPTVEVIADIVPAIVAGFHWPKSMRWGAGVLRWVRPLQSVLCVFGGKPVPFAIDTGDGILRAGHDTVGHRFLSSGKLHVTGFEDYREKLARAHVVLDAEERKEIIARDLARLAAAEGLEVIEDAGLLEEVAGLVEDPVVLIGKIDESFLDVPPEVLSTAMRAHQKYFSLRDKAAPSPSPLPAGGERVNAKHSGEGQGSFAPRFGVVANLRAKDGGKAIVAGNERVLRARLSDARFFWDQDRKDTLESRVGALEGITFHARLGTMAERAQRIERLARVIAPLVGADVEQAARAAKLCKADLTSGMVGEFPELQGVMGRYYALNDGEPATVADAIRDHYKPQGPTDSVPTEPVSIAVALADKLDMLVAFWAIDEKPTGSKDPFALRRAALGVVRIALENNLRLGRLFAENEYEDFMESTLWPHWHYVITGYRGADPELQAARDRLKEHRAKGAWQHRQFLENFKAAKSITVLPPIGKDSPPAWTKSWQDSYDVFAFLADRLKVYLRDRGARHDLVDAVCSLPGQDDLVLIVKRVEALSSFLATEDGKSLLTAHDRAANILRIEEKKDNKQYTDEPDPAKFQRAEEKDLYAAILTMQKEADAALAKVDFEAAMRALAKLRTPVDTFFDKVTVNAKEAPLRENRLKLLSLIRRAMTKVADFSKIEGVMK